MLGLTLQEQVLIAILVAAFAAILSNRVRPDLVALLVLAALGLGGVLPANVLLAGFGNPAVVAIAALAVITAALERTGVVAWLGARLERAAAGRERRLTLLFMGTAALLSLGMNNLAAVAILMPAAVAAGRSSGLAASRLLLPIAFGTLLGGMATLFTTANLIVSGSLVAQGARPLTLLDFLPVGGAVALGGLAYLATIGRRLLPVRQGLTGAALSRPDLAATYQLAERLWEVAIDLDSPLVGKPLAASVIGSRLGVTVLALLRGGRALMPVAPEELIAAGDVLVVLGREERVRPLEREGATIGRGAAAGPPGAALAVRFTEVVVAPRSPALGQTLKQLQFRSKYGLTAVALWRSGRSYRTDVGDFALEAGDALLTLGPAERVGVLAREPGFIVLEPPERQPPPLGLPGLAAIAITLTVLAFSAFGVFPTGASMLVGAAALIVAGAIDLDEAYRAVEWKVLLVIVGLLPLGVALLDSGLAADLAAAVARGLAPWGPLALLAGLFLGAAALTQVVGGAVAALVLSPLVVPLAARAASDPAPLGVALAIGCSTAFLTPMAHPVNLLVMGPAGYRPSDFARIGAGLTLVCLLALLAAAPLAWRL